MAAKVCDNRVSIKVRQFYFVLSVFTIRAKAHIFCIPFSHLTSGAAGCTDISLERREGWGMLVKEAWFTPTGKFVLIGGLSPMVATRFKV